MKKGIPPLVIGNWKMNPQSSSLASRLAKELKKSLARVEGVTVVVAPPHVYLGDVDQVKNGSKAFALGAQNVHHEKLGAHTGEISLLMLKSFEVTHVILGHSERRREGETDEAVNQKLTATIKAGLTGVVCVGEGKRDGSGHYLSHVEMQVRKALANVSKAKLGQVVVAYEPIWAIGTGVNATGTDVHEMRLFIEKVISDIYGRNEAQRVQILYGGSVNGKNSKELFTLGTVDGFLVGGASLHADEFTQIVKSTQTL
jgi:triosephosphate isomerase